MFKINNDSSSAGLETARQNSINHHEAILDDLGLRDLDGWRGTEYHNTENKWAWVFEQPNDGLHDDDYELEARIQETRNIHESVQAGQYGDDQWLSLFGDEILRSPYQFGDYAYTVVAGGGSGNTNQGGGGGAGGNGGGVGVDCPPNIHIRFRPLLWI